MARLILLVTITLLIQSCATLSKSECRKADWQIIGLEDGSAGRPVSYISRHRKSCAEHGVKPKLSQYQIGHAEGAVLFCKPRKGFELGNAGRKHNDICPAALRSAFLAAYDDGWEVHTARSALKDAETQLEAAKTDINAVKEDIKRLEALLVSGNGTAKKRKKWLDELKQRQSEEEQLQISIHDLEHLVSDRQQEYDYLSSQYRY